MQKGETDWARYSGDGASAPSTETVAADGHVTEREAELLRAITDSLDCPVPPFVEAIRTEELAHEQ